VPFANLAAVVAAVAPLAERFASAGHRLYLVGGIVRDQWLDQVLGDSADIDLTTDAGPQVVKELVADLATAVWTQGERFGTIGLRHQGHAVEITTHRAETYDAGSRKPEVVFGDDVGVDLSRRDFTVNAMAIEVPGGDLVDPWGGATDLEARVLRTPLTPEISFSDDPLRMVRAARFSARFDLEPTPELIAAATELRERLRIVAIERIGDELERLFGLPDPERGIRFLVDTGLADELLTWNRPSATPPARQRLADAAGVVARVDHPDWRSRFAAFVQAAWIDSDEVAASLSSLRLSGDDRKAVHGIVRDAVALCALSDLVEPEPSRLRRWFHDTQRQPEAIAVAAALLGPRVLPQGDLLRARATSARRTAHTSAELVVRTS